MTREEFREKLVASLGEDFSHDYFDRSSFVPGRPDRLHPWSGTAEERWRTRGRPFLREQGVVLAERMSIGAWRETV